MSDSFLAEGFILEKTISTGCSKKLANPKILIANTPMDTDKIKIYGTKVNVSSMEKVAEIEAAEKEKLAIKCQKIISYKPDIFVNRQLIYDYQQSLLMQAGICVIEHADFEGVERLS